jgi:4-hydroxybenzoate polyprenyltransferase
VFRPGNQAGLNRINSFQDRRGTETKNANRLALVRGVHTFIYIVMATSTLPLVYAGLTGAHRWWLWVALSLLAVETVVFAGNG